MNLADELKQIEGNEQLVSSFQKFVEVMINEKSIDIQVEKYDFIEYLIENSLVKEEKDLFRINDHKTAAYFLYQAFKTKLGFEENENIANFINFIRSIKEWFNEAKILPGFWKIWKYIWLYIVNYFNKFSEDYRGFIEILNNSENPEDTFLLIEAYATLLPYLDITEEFQYDNVDSMLLIVKSDATFNLAQGKLLGGVRDKCNLDYNYGIQLFHYILQKDNFNLDFLSAVVTGLYEANGKQFYEDYLKEEIVNNNEITKSIIFGISNIKINDETDCELMVNIFKENISVPEFLSSCIALMFAIVNSTFTKFYNECTGRLIELLEDQNAAIQIINFMFRYNGNVEVNSRIFIALMQKPYCSAEPDKYLGGIHHILLELSEDQIEILKNLINTAAEYLPFKNVAKFFSPLTNMVNKAELENFLIQLLTSNEASKRFIAINIIDDISIGRAYKFSIDLLDLKPLIQYKLCLSLIQNYRDPKHHIPAILPLLDSKSELVQECLIHNLEIMSEDYGGHVIEVLNNNLENGNSHYEKIKNRISQYLKQYSLTHIKPKDGIKELNPYYTHSHAFNLYNKLMGRSFNRTVEKDTREKSIFGQLGVKTVTLSKGGGYKFGDRKISKLSKISSSFALPRVFFINPDIFELSKGKEMRDNWSDDEFMDIEKGLL